LHGPADDRFPVAARRAVLPQDKPARGKRIAAIARNCSVPCGNDPRRPALILN
jgi:hypothetical protein